MKLQYSFPTAFMSTEPPDWNEVKGGSAPWGPTGGTGTSKQKRPPKSSSFIICPRQRTWRSLEISSGYRARSHPTETKWKEDVPLGGPTGGTGTSKQKKTSEDVFFVLRYQAESNCCRRFCRPLPNHSAMVPIQDCKCSINLSFCKLF